MMEYLELETAQYAKIFIMETIVLKSVIVCSVPVMMGLQVLESVFALKISLGINANTRNHVLEIHVILLVFVKRLRNPYKRICENLIEIRNNEIISPQGGVDQYTLGDIILTGSEIKFQEVETTVNGRFDAQNGRIDLTQTILNIEDFSGEDTEIRMDLNSQLTISNCESGDFSEIRINAENIEDREYNLMQASCSGIEDQCRV